MEIRLFQVDAFTRDLFAGNPAGVVLNAEGLDSDTMQKIAREMNLSETAFIINRTSEDYDLEVRFFTPTNEVPICGHATISAHYVYAKEHGISSGIIRQKTGAGILPVEIIEDRDDIRIAMTQADIEFGNVIDGPEKVELLKGLGIQDTDLQENLPIQIVSTGHSKVLVPVKSNDVLDGIVIDSMLLSALSGEIGCNGYYVFTFDTREENVLASGRMFAPAIGIAEDPVTGNANGPLGAYLTQYGILEPIDNEVSFRIKEGEKIGRKGYMEVSVGCESGRPWLVKILGNARIVFRTVLELGLDQR